MPPITTDPKNANKGTSRGRALLERSLRDYGAGRSVLADKHGTLIAGNKTYEEAFTLGIPTREVHTTGDELVVVVRDDLDLATDAAAKELAIADNRVGELDLDWDAEMLAGLAEDVDLSAFWMDWELGSLLGTTTANDPAAEWVGMPEYENEDQRPVKQLIVNFRSEADVESFARLTDQRIVMSTKSIWYPRTPAREFTDTVWQSDDRDEDVHA